MAATRASASGQQKITQKFPSIPVETQRKLDAAFAKVCYVNALPFSHYESEEMKDALQKLNPAYKPPTAKIIGGRLLISAYEDLKVKVDAMIADLQYLNLISDESSNINGARIVNACLFTEYGALHHFSQDIGAERLTAPNVATILRKVMHEISNGNTELLNSLATDTCDTMLSTWRHVRAYPELKHVFFIPCDSHGLQLLLKDVVSLPVFKAILDQAQKIARAFKKSKLQLARLRAIQLEDYGHHISLCLSVITRWGTQFRLVQSIINSRDAIRRYALTWPDAETELPYKASVCIEDPTFWTGVEQLRELLKPLDEAVKMSESGKSHLGTVIQRWETVIRHLNSQSRFYPQLQTFMEPNKGFAQRYARQVLPIHIAAYYLIPANRALSRQLDANPDYRVKLFDFFVDYSKSDEDAKALRIEYIHYVTQRSPLEPSHICWLHEDDPKDFWLFASISTTHLAQLALRVFNAPCNSVPSERAFSIQNLIHSKIRNRLHPDKVDKLTYIYMNSRVLKLKSNPSSNEIIRSPLDLSEEQLVQMEDELLEDEEIRDMDDFEEDCEDFSDFDA